jgi:hypothetical protein
MLETLTNDKNVMLGYQYNNKRSLCFHMKGTFDSRMTTVKLTFPSTLLEDGNNHDRLKVLVKWLAADCLTGSDFLFFNTVPGKVLRNGDRRIFP